MTPITLFKTKDMPKCLQMCSDLTPSSDGFDVFDSKAQSEPALLSLWLMRQSPFLSLKL